MQHVVSVIEQHGLLVVFLNVLLAQSGLPVPAFPTLMAAAALVAQSGYQVPAIILSGVSGSMIADLAGIGAVSATAVACSDCFVRFPCLRISAFARLRRCSQKSVPGRCCSRNSFRDLRPSQWRWLVSPKCRCPSSSCSTEL